MARKQKAATLDRIRKITVKTVCGGVDFDKLMEAKGKRLDLMTVYGVARRPQPGASDLGTYCAFLGEFRAVNHETGEVHAASKMILPKIAEEMLAGVVAPDGSREVKFALQISVKYDPEAATKYVYLVRPLTDTADSDVMSELEGVLVSRKLLSAPPVDETETEGAE